MSVWTMAGEGVDPRWPGLAAGGPLLTSPSWLAAMDGRLGSQTVTFLAGETGRPASLAVLATVQARPRPGEIFDLHYALISPAEALPLTGATRSARNELAAHAPGPAQWAPNLLVMLPGYECVPVGPGSNDPQLLDALVRATLEYAAGAGLRAVAFLYTRPDAVALTDALAGHGFVEVPLSVTWDLPVPPGGLPEYLSRLPRKRRLDVGRELRNLANAGVTVQEAAIDSGTVDKLLEEMIRLRLQLVEKYRGHVDEHAERRRLSRLVRDVTDVRPRVLAAMAGEAMVGFALFSEHDRGRGSSPGGTSEWHCLVVGYDYNDPRSRLAYFATAYYSAVEAAAAAGATSIGYGHGSAQAKRARGCAGTVLSGWVHTRDDRLAAAVRTSAAITALELPAPPRVAGPEQAGPAASTGAG